MNIQEQIFESIDVIVKKRLREIKNDTTIEGIISSDEKALHGEYLIRYQDIEFTAFSENNTVRYLKDDNVLISVQEGDFSKKKTIKGKAENKGEEFLDIQSELDKIYKVGVNFVNNSDTLEIILDAKDNQEALIPIDEEDMIKSSQGQKSLIVAANVLTDLPNELGDFGIEITVEFDNVVQKTYKLSPTDMTGNPQRLIGQYQFAVSTLPNNRLTKVVKVRAYADKFKTPIDRAIKFTNIEIQYVRPITAAGIAQYTGNVQARRGNIFKNGSLEQGQSLTLFLEARKNGRPFLPEAIYKWFVMDASVVTPESPGFDSDVGYGWKKLVDESGNYENVSTNELRVYARAVPNFSVFKGVAIFEDQLIEGVETLIDQTDPLIIDVISSKGDVFIQGEMKTTTLECIVKTGVDIIDKNKFLYSWMEIEEDGTNKIITNKSEMNSIDVLVESDIDVQSTFICDVYLRE